MYWTGSVPRLGRMARAVRESAYFQEGFAGPDWHRRVIDAPGGRAMTDAATRDTADAEQTERYMRLALALAAEAAARGEVPVGAVVVMDGQVRGEGWNQPIGAHDPTAHAEIVAMRAAAQAVQNYRLTGATLYVTIEPCQMCVGAMVHARIGRVVYGAPEPRAGAIESAMRAHEHPSLNHRLTAIGGVLEVECRAVIQDFFAARRALAAKSPAAGA